MKTFYKIIFAFILIEFLFPNSVFPQQAPFIQWQKSYGGTANDQARSIVQTSDGGYVILGQSESNDGNVTGNHGDLDFWILKTDSIGNIQWQKSIGGSNEEWAGSIIQTANGGYAVAGSSFSDDGDVTGHHGASGMADFWVVTLDSIGTILWQKSLGGSLHDNASCIIQTADYGFIVTGRAQSFDGDVTGHLGSSLNSDYWVVKLDSSGTIQWQKCFGGSSNDEPSSIIQTNDGGYAISGASVSNDSDVTGHHGGSYYDYWVLKLDNTGTAQWGKSLGGTASDIANSIVQSIDGGYVVAGYINSSDGDVTSNYGITDSWIIKLDSSSNIQWENNLGGTISDFGHSVIRDIDGGYVVAIETSSNDSDVTGNHGSYDYWIVKLNNAGNIEWQKCLGGSSSEKVFSIKQTSDSGFVVAGFSSSNDGDVTVNYGLTDYWIVKLSHNTITSIQYNQNSISGFNLYPNPANTILTINLNKKETILITNVLGEIILEKAFSNDNETKADLDVSSLATGIYFIKAGNEVRKFVKE